MPVDREAVRPPGEPPSGVSAVRALEELLRASAELFREVLGEVEEQTGIGSSQYDVLVQLARARQPMRTPDLRRHLLLSQPALSRVLTSLEGDGLVRRQRDPADARAQLVSLTPEGRRRWRGAGAIVAAGAARAFRRSLTGPQTEQLTELLVQLRAGLRGA